MTSIVMLALNGEGIPLKDMRVTPTMQIQDKDQSGQTSSTGTAEQGIKPKELRVSGVVPYANPEILKRIFELAQAKDTAGKQQTYRVAHLVANTIGFREATFTGTVDAPQQDGKMAWLVTFTLRENRACPRRKKPAPVIRPQPKNKRKTAAAKGAVVHLLRIVKN